MLLVFFILFCLIIYLFVCYSKFEFIVDLKFANIHSIDRKSKDIKYRVNILFIPFNFKFLKFKFFYIDNKFFKFLFLKKDSRILYLKVLEGLERTSVKFDRRQIKKISLISPKINIINIDTYLFLIDPIITANLIGYIYIFFYYFLSRIVNADFMKKINLNLKLMDRKKKSFFELDSSIYLSFYFSIKNLILSILKIRGDKNGTSSR